MFPLPLLPMFAMVAAQPSLHAPIEGLWKNPIGSAIIDVAPCGNTLCGRVVWASPRGEREVAAHTAHIIGTTVLTAVRPKANGWAGKLYIPDDNIHVSAKLQLIGAGELRLTGCALAGLVCRSQIWTRTQEPLPSTE